MKHRLALAALPLAQQLTPAGVLKGPNWWFRNPRRADGGNLHTASVNVRRGFWKDFSNAGGGEGGDMLHFVATMACGGDYKRAWRWSLDWLGLTGRAPDRAEAARLAQAAGENAAVDARRLARTRAFCMHLWLEAQPLDGHDPASLYLAGRGIDVQALAGGIPRSLRFHPHVETRTERGVHFPALVAYAALDGLKNGLATLHCTWLEPRGAYYVKASRGERPSKEVICSYAGASVRLQRGASQKRLCAAPAGSSAIIAEGLENALTVAIACPEERVLAALSVANMGTIALPDSIARVTLAKDNDAGNVQGERALERAIAIHQEQGREVLIAAPPADAKDFNEALTGAAA